MYLLNTRRNAAQREYIGDLDTSYERENRLDATNQESFGKYVDAEQEIEKRQHNLKDRVNTLRTEPNLPVGDRVDPLNREDEAIKSGNKGRSAGQGS